ncbi:LysR family transcriptional regulator [Photobacterium sp. OFAV2-7]|uniref:LysR family transcriptional regulator n=1 Tax=Photobacterium sp. OFAV2-7 TaxID=2917748 RepID=UPI001EF6248B|nr:LysR family transcriptional regulator [Photobacterium sp. OFAV2-7]MCG7585724.1 LysR family transcriptional regulator [Photobacterium sp. OFAV2-7]
MSKYTQYRVFVTVVEAGSISKAALKLHYSAPAVSKQIVALENSLKAQLFSRSHKKIQVTESGKKFYQRCKSVLAAIESAEDELLSEQDAVTGELSITMSKSLCRSNIFDLIKGFSDEYSNIRFNISFSDEIENLHESNIDFAFRLGQLQDNNNVIAIPLLDTQLVACATPEYVKQHGLPNSFNNLGTGSLMLSSSLNMSEELRRFLKKEDVLVNEHPPHVSDDIEAVYHSVRSGLSIGFMLDISVSREIENGEFLSLLQERKLPKKRLYLLYKKTEWKSQKQQVFKEYIKSHMKQALARK